MLTNELIEWTYAYRRLMVTDMACELGVFARLATRPHASGELARCLGATEVPLTSLLDACVGVGLLSLDRGEYANRPIAEAHLLAGRPQ